MGDQQDHSTFRRGNHKADWLTGWKMSLAPQAQLRQAQAAEAQPLVTWQARKALPSHKAVHIRTCSSVVTAEHMLAYMHGEDMGRHAAAHHFQAMQLIAAQAALQVHIRCLTSSLH